jgi:transposase InsO family protein
VEEKPSDKVNRQFKADRPNAPWVSDSTYISIWQAFVYAAFVIDFFARWIVRWRLAAGGCRTRRRRS